MFRNIITNTQQQHFDVDSEDGAVEEMRMRKCRRSLQPPPPPRVGVVDRKKAKLSTTLLIHEAISKISNC
jgi:hypothetical protein